VAANSAVVGLLRVLLTANTAEFEAAMKRSANAATKWSKDLRSIGQQATAVGSTLTKALTLPIVGIATASVKASIDFESSFAGVRKTVDATEEEFAQMAQGFRDLAKTIPINVNELNRLGEAAGALGIPKAEIVDFARVMALLGVTTNVTSDQAAESIAKIQNIFKAAGKETENFASTLVALGNDGASTEEQILSMAENIAGAGNAVGMTQGQVLAFASALSSVGLEADKGGSAISRVFIDIAEAVSKGGDALANFAKVAGEPVEQFAKLFKEDAAEAVRRFVEGLSKIKESGGDLIGTLDALGFSEIRVRDTLLRTAGAGDLLTRALQLQDKAWRENSALTEEARKRFETTEAQLKLLWGRIKDVGITLGNALLPAIQSTIGFLDTLLPIVEMLARAFSVLPGPVQAGVIAIGALVAAAGPLILLFGQLAFAASNLTALFGKKGVATRLLAGEFLTLKGASTALATSLGFLAKAAGVAAAAFVGWQIGRLISDLLGLDKKIANTITGMQNLQRARSLTAQGQTADADAEVQARLTDLTNQRTEALKRLNFVHAMLLTNQINALKNDQTRLAMMDTINKARAQGAAAEITYADAVAFNAQKERERTVATKAAVEETKNVTSETQKAAPAVEGLGIALSKTSTEAKKATDWLSEFRESTSELATQITAAEKAGATMPVMLDLFGDAAQKAAKRADAWGMTVEESVQRVATALQDAEISQAVKAMMDDAGKEAARLVGEMEKAGEEAGRRFVEGLRKSNTEFISTLSDLRRRWLQVEGDSLEQRQALIRLDFEDRRRQLDQHATFYDEHLRLLNAEEAKALADARANWEQELKARKTSFSTMIKALAESFTRLSQVANGALGSIAQGFAMIVTAVDTVMESVSSLTKGLKNIGKDFLGGLAGIFSGIGGLVSVVVSLWQKFFGSRGRDMVKEFAASFGGFDALRQRLLVLGDEGERLWKNLTQGVGRNNPEQAQAAIDAITAALGRAEQQTEAFNSSLNGMLREVQELGGDLPDALRGYLDQLRNAGQLTQENIDLLALMAGGGQVSWETMRDVAEKYGISIDGLGKRFQQQRLHAGWQEIIDDMDLLIRGGADVNAVLNGMKDEISKLVQESIKFGTDIPENMRPWIEKLIKSGKLLDENGDKITDINQLTFGETIETGLQKLIKSIENLIVTLGGVPTAFDDIEDAGVDAANAVRDALGRIPKNVRVDIDINEPRVTLPGNPESVLDPQFSHAATGGLVTDAGVQYRAAGGPIVRALTASVIGKPKGTDTVPAMLTPGELILNEAQQGTIGAALDASTRFLDRLKADTMAAVSQTSMNIGEQPLSMEQLDTLLQQNAERPIHIHNAITLEVEKRTLAKILTTDIRRGGDVRVDWFDALGLTPRASGITR
jgi:TP901 family phage tail tape measure protein